MKKTITLLLTIVMVICLVNINNSHTKAEEGNNNNYLCFTAVEASTVKYSQKWNPYTLDIQVSTDGSSFTAWNAESSKTLAIGEKIYIKGNNNSISNGPGQYTYFVMSGKIAVSGSVMSLLDGVGSTTNIQSENCFYNLFKDCTSIVSITDDLLPATTLASGCYKQMFQGCTGLTSIPEGLLPATTLVANCYFSMFQQCSGLTSIPEGLLPATTLEINCYSDMFRQCTSLELIPEGLLPAGKGGVGSLAESCYYQMFYGCSGLKSIPEAFLPVGKDGLGSLKRACYDQMFSECTGLTSLPLDLLPAKTIAEKSYYSMFSGCTGLTSIPEKLLQATTLADNCYEEMFNGCTGLTSIPEKLLPATTLESFCYKSMFSGCSEITNIPDLPATTLADDCYEEMFNGCVKLPEGMLETPTAVLTEKFTIPTSGTISTHGNNETTNMFGGITELTATPDLSSGSKDYYRKATEPEHKFECEGTTCKTTITDDEIIDQTAHCEGVDFTKLVFGGATKVEKIGASTTELIKDSEYTLSNGSVNVTLKKDYLKKLGVGTHKFIATLNDGTKHEFSIVISIEKAGEPSKPVVKDESCEKVIGPTWHWNNTKGICEDVGVVGTSTR